MLPEGAQETISLPFKGLCVNNFCQPEPLSPAGCVLSAPGHGVQKTPVFPRSAGGLSGFVGSGTWNSWIAASFPPVASPTKTLWPTRALTSSSELEALHGPGGSRGGYKRLTDLMQGGHPIFSGFTQFLPLVSLLKPLPRQSSLKKWPKLEKWPKDPEQSLGSELAMGTSPLAMVRSPIYRCVYSIYIYTY